MVAPPTSTVSYAVCTKFCSVTVQHYPSSGLIELVLHTLLFSVLFTDPINYISSEIRRMNMERWWDNSDKAKPKQSEKDGPSATSSTTYFTWIGLRFKPDLRD